MEKNSQLIEDAARVIEVADRSLEAPDLEQLFHEYSTFLGGDYHLSVRSQAILPSHNDPMGSTRYLYLNGPHTAGNCRPLLSLDINTLMNDREVTGLIDDISALDTILSVVDPSLVTEMELLKVVQEIMFGYQSGQVVTDDLLVALQATFSEVLSNGALVSYRDLHIRGDDGSRLSVEGCRFEGSLQHVGPPWIHKPKTKVSLRLPDSVNQTVVSLSENGQFESWVEHSDGMERAAQRADPADVHRDSSGKVMFVSTRGYGEQAIIAAERAMGLRELEVGRVAVVTTYVDEYLSPLTNRGE